MDASIELQKQVKDNAEDLRNYLSDLATWVSEIKSENKTSPSSTVKVSVCDTPCIMMRGDMSKNLPALHTCLYPNQTIKLSL